MTCLVHPAPSCRSLWVTGPGVGQVLTMPAVLHVPLPYGGYLLRNNELDLAFITLPANACHIKKFTTISCVGQTISVSGGEEQKHKGLKELVLLFF